MAGYEFITEVGIPVSLGAALSKGASAVLKGLYKVGSFIINARPVLNGLNLRQAFEVVCQLVDVAARGIRVTVSTIDEAIAALNGIFRQGMQLWDDFCAFAARVKVEGLLRLGFDDGSWLVGKVLRQGVSLTDETMVAIKNIGTDLARAGIVLSEDATIGLAKLTDDIGEDGARRFLGSVTQCLLSRNVDGFKASLGKPNFSLVSYSVKIPYQQNNLCSYGDEILGKIIKNINFKLSQRGYDGLNNFVKNNGIDSVNGAINRFQARGYSSTVLDKTITALNKQTMNWADSAIDGLAKVVNRVDGNLVEEIIGYNGGKYTGMYVFQWLNRVGDADSPRFNSWARRLTGKEGRDEYVSAYFELRYGSEEIIGAGGNIKTFAHHDSLGEGMDIIGGRWGISNYHFELKNWNTYPGRTSAQFVEMEKQFARNVGVELKYENGRIVEVLTTPTARYGDENYAYVFRGKKDERVKDALCFIAHRAASLNLLTNLDNFRIVFLDWSDALPLDDGKGTLSGSGGNQAEYVGCR